MIFGDESSEGSLAAPVEVFSCCCTAWVPSVPTSPPLNWTVPAGRRLGTAAGAVPGLGLAGEGLGLGLAGEGLTGGLTRWNLTGDCSTLGDVARRRLARLAELLGPYAEGFSSCISGFRLGVARLKRLCRGNLSFSASVKRGEGPSMLVEEWALPQSEP